MNMNTKSYKTGRSVGSAERNGIGRRVAHGSEQGSVLLVVLALLVLLGVIIVSNSLALRDLKGELQRIEKRQIEKAATEWKIQPAS